MSHYYWHMTRDGDTLFTQSRRGSNSSCITTARDLKSLCTLGFLDNSWKNVKEICMRAALNNLLDMLQPGDMRYHIAPVYEHPLTRFYCWVIIWLIVNHVSYIASVYDRPRMQDITLYVEMLLYNHGVKTLLDSFRILSLHILDWVLFGNGLLNLSGDILIFLPDSF